MNEKAPNEVMVELPLVTGLGQGTDAHVRETASVVSRNVRYDIGGSVRTRRYIDERMRASTALTGVASSTDAVYVTSDSRAMMVANRRLVNATGVHHARPTTVNGLFPDLVGAAFVRALPLPNGGLVVWWQEPTDGAQWDAYYAIVDSNDMVVMNRRLLKESTSGSNSALGVEAVFTDGTSRNIMFAFATPRAAATSYDVSFEEHALDAAFDSVTSVNLRGISVVIGVANDEFNLSFVLSGTHYVATLGNIAVALHATTFLTSSDTILEGGLAVPAPVFVGYDSTNDKRWIAWHERSGASNELDLVVGELSTEGAVTFKTVAAQCGYTDGTAIATRAGFFGAFVFGASGGWVVANSGSTTEQLRSSVTFTVERFNEPIPRVTAAALTLPGSAAGSVRSWSNVMLGGHPVLVGNSDDLRFPVVAFDTTHYSEGLFDPENDVPAHYLHKYVGPTWTTKRGVIDGKEWAWPGVEPVSGEYVDRTILSPPLYTMWGCARSVNGNNVIAETYAVDTGVPCVDIGGRWAFPGACVLDPDGKEVHVILEKRSETAVPWGGVGNGNANDPAQIAMAVYPTGVWDQIKEGWSSSISVCRFEDTESPLRLVGKGSTLVSSSSYIGVVDGLAIRPTSFPIPPSHYSSVPEDFPGRYPAGAAWNALDVTTGDSATIDVVLCWAWRGSDGVIHRSPPSHATSVTHDHLWLLATELYVGRPEPFSIMFDDDVFLEIYRQDVGGPSDTLYLFHREKIKKVSPELADYARVYIDLGVPQRGPRVLLYTNGGALANELIPTDGFAAIVAGRVWTFHDRRAYFSQSIQRDVALQFNTALYIDSPDASQIMGVAQMDEQVVILTRNGIFVARGAGPNRAGGGGGFRVQAVSASTGCVSRESVVSTDAGVFFKGDRGYHVLTRNMAVQYLGDIELFAQDNIVSAVYDKVAKELVISSDKDTAVLDVRTGKWTLADLVRGAVTGVDWAMDGLVVTTGSSLCSSSSLVPVDARSSEYEVDEAPPMLHSTPWMLSPAQGYMRARRVLVQGHVVVGSQYIPEIIGQPGTPASTISPDPRAVLTVRVYMDHQTLPAWERDYQLSQFGQQDPLEIDIHVPTQRCRALRVEFETPVCNIDLSLTAVSVAVEPIPGRSLRPTTPRI